MKWKSVSILKQREIVPAQERTELTKFGTVVTQMVPPDQKPSPEETNCHPSGARVMGRDIVTAQALKCAISF